MRGGGVRGELREQPARDKIGQHMKALQIGDRGPAKIEEIEEIEEIEGVFLNTEVAVFWPIISVSPALGFMFTLRIRTTSSVF